MYSTLSTIVILATVLAGAFGIIKTHPQSQNTTEGSTATFTCKIRDCDHCSVIWRVHNLETFERFNPRAEDFQNDDHGNGRTTSTLSITADSSSVVQCVEHNPSATRRIEKNSYSQYALLRVLKSEGSGESQ
ncbi:hypothetical protein GBAR_LOCUS23944, partial [Geodia barretti]